MRAAACVACLAAGIAGLAAQQQQQPIRVGTNFVRVDVYPTRDGRIVDGLQAADFDVLEDGVSQAIDTFEHVVAMRGPQTARTEATSQQEMVKALANPKARVFLLFLDGAFVDDIHARAINAPLIKFLTTHLADDDLVGLMTPSMSAPEVTFGTKTAVIAGGLPTAFLGWGRQNYDLDPVLDRREIQYGLCYPGSDVAGKMVARSRERKTLESLQDAVRFLASIREERKAIIAVTEGWVLYREDPGMMRRGTNEAPLGIDKIRVGPTGQLTLEDTKTSVNALNPAACDGDRAYLAGIDNDRFLRDIIDDANRGNSTFYMIDPSGLTLKRADRSHAMRTLANNTDGFAMLNSNDLNLGFDRIATDMASYYLLGYNTTNTKPDGRYRSITVRVKQPGVEVRARKGYRAPTAEEISEARNRVAAAPVAPGAATVLSAIDRLGKLRPDAQFQVSATLGTGSRPGLWVAGELQAPGGRPDEFMEGARAAIEAVSGGGSTTAAVTLKPGERTFLTRLELPAAPSGALDVRVRLTALGGSAAPLSEGVRIEPADAEIHPVMFRRGVTTGNRLLPAAAPRFSRTERIRLDFPVGNAPNGATPVSARVLDRGGLATQVPVAVTERTEEGTGQRWIAADLALAALSPGDYAVELEVVVAGTTRKTLTAIRVVR
jgi:VWFA-related protein